MQRSIFGALNFKPINPTMADELCRKNGVPPNFDGAMFDESNEAGHRLIIHNSAGEVMATLSENIKKLPSVVTLELLAARRAAIFVHESDSISLLLKEILRLRLTLYGVMGWKTLLQVTL